MAQANSNSSSNKNNNNRKCPPRHRRPPPPGDDVIAGRTRQQRRTTIASKWNNLTIPIKIEIFSYLDQESLMNLSLVSKQSNDIIRNVNEPGNKNEIIPVFEIGLISMTALCQNLLDHSLNRETNNKLQRYQIMRFKDSCKYKEDDENFSFEAFMELRRETIQKVRITGITSFDVDGYPSRHGNLQDRVYQHNLIFTLSFILPNLREVNFSDMPVTGLNLRALSKNCPLLEKITLNNNDISDLLALINNDMFTAIRLDGSHMRHSKSLKEIYMDSSSFECGLLHRNTIEDLNNRPEIYMLHRCCKTLERVSIRNPKFCDEDDKTISQDTLIKFVRNAPPTLRWFRSDLTLDNMKMLRLEQPGIELLN